MGLLHPRARFRGLRQPGRRGSAPPPPPPPGALSEAPSHLARGLRREQMLAAPRRRLAASRASADVPASDPATPREEHRCRLEIARRPSRSAAAGVFGGDALLRKREVPVDSEPPGSLGHLPPCSNGSGGWAALILDIKCTFFIHHHMRRAKGSQEVSSQCCPASSPEALGAGVPHPPLCAPCSDAHGAFTPGCHLHPALPHASATPSPAGSVPAAHAPFTT